MGGGIRIGRLALVFSECTVHSYGLISPQILGPYYAALVRFSTHSFFCLGRPYVWFYEPVGYREDFEKLCFSIQAKTLFQCRIGHPGGVVFFTLYREFWHLSGAVFALEQLGYYRRAICADLRYWGSLYQSVCASTNVGRYLVYGFVS